MRRSVSFNYRRQRPNRTLVSMILVRSRGKGRADLQRSSKLLCRESVGRKSLIAVSKRRRV